MLKDLSLAKFGEILGSDAPAPGGGSVAALSGMLAANLVTMVCRLTIGKKGYEAYTEEVEEVLGHAETLAASLLGRVDSDTEAFNGVMAAFKMPKETDEQKAARTAAIQKGYQDAVQSPLAIAQECLQVLELAERLLGKANTNALSDLGVAGQQAIAGVEGALMNVMINLPSIKNEKFIQEKNIEVSHLRQTSSVLSTRIYKDVINSL